MNDRLARIIDSVQNLSPARRRWTSLIVFGVAVSYLILTALYQDRQLIPKFHDEHMHLLQTQMLARGKLWMHPHPLADFFETFHVFVKPVYASVYFPGTALIYLPMVWLHLPFWFLPLLVAGAMVALTFRSFAEVIDPIAGVLAALMMISLQWFRYLSLMVMSHSVMVLLGLSIIYAWLRWRREKKLAWVMMIGGLMGWSAITRPVDALVYSVPVGVAMLIELRRDGLRKIAATIALIVACAIPFLALQVIENIGVTGDALKTPYRLYADLYTPQMSFGFHQFDPSVRPKTNLPQRQDYYDQFTVPAAREHRPDNLVSVWLHERFPLLASVTVPNRFLLLLLPLSIGALCRIDRRVIWAMLPIYIAFYAVFAYLLPVYCVVIAPIVIAWVLMGKAFIERIARGRRDWVVAAMSLVIIVLSIAALPEIDHQVLDDGFLTPTMAFSYIELPRHVAEGRAVVLFRYHKGDNTNEEPVYNVDVAWPDDAQIIRAHDLGVERDRELFDYYARRQPDRTVYLYDRSSRTLVTLGNVAELAKRFPLTSDDHQRGPSSSGPM